MVRRVGDWSSGPRTVGYDANPRGLAGTPSIQDYKNKQKQKKKDKKKQEENKPDPPYKKPEEDVVTIIPLDDKYETQHPNPSIEGYNTKVKIGDGVKGTDGEGWTLRFLLSDDFLDWYSVSEITPVFRKDSKGNTTSELDYGYLSITNVSDRNQIRLPTSPLENGSVKHDHKVIMPKTYRITGLVKRENATQMNRILEIAKLSYDLKQRFSLQSPWGNYDNMYLQNFSSKADNRRYDVYEYNIDLSELLIAMSLTDTTNDAELVSSTPKKAVNVK